MKGDVESLSDRERETLRLLGRGHEAKSIASALGLSVHTVNERVRAARRKLGVSSSREAARILLASDAASAAPKNFAYKEIGVPSAIPVANHAVPARRPATSPERRAIYVVIGAVMFISFVALVMSLGTAADDGKVTLSGPRTAQAMTNLPSLFVAEDYPAEALAQGVQGSTMFRLRISELGRVERCDIERSSGSAALDQATCRVIAARARFRPAIDAAGRPVASAHSGAISWKSEEAKERP